jgi:hypothetical protein
MKAAAFLVVVASSVFAQTSQPSVVDAKLETRAYSGDLNNTIRGSAPAWFGYAVKSVKNNDDGSCCWDDGSRGCWLEERKKGWPVATSNRPVQLEGSDQMAILFRVENNSVEKIRAFSMSCPLDAGGLPFVWLTGVPLQASLRYLEKFATGSADHMTDGAIFAIGQHAGNEPDEVLAQLTRPSQPERTREKATFWLGASRGARGVAILKQILASDPSDQVRDKAVFALSISKQPEALEYLIHAANTDPSAHVRSQALFWLAQKAGKRAAETITNAIQNDPDTEVKKKAVFALSQLPKDEGIPKLIEVAKMQNNPEVRKQAFFWLGQSHDPRALAFIEQVLTK